MARLSIPIVFVVFAFLGWAVSGEEAASDSRQPRSHRQRKLCRKYGICNQGGYGGFQGGHGGYGGYQQGGYQGGYGGIPPINIGISQSQSSANAGGGGYGHGSYPNNYQYNNHGGYGGQEGYGGYHQGGYQRPGYSNGFGSYNNQFNGNYYGGNGGGYGFQGPFGNGFYDESNVEHEEDGHHADDEANYAASGSFAVAGRSKG